VEHPPTPRSTGRSAIGWTVKNWPWLLLLVTFVVASALAGPAVGLAMALLVFPISGVGYLIRNRRRRSRGTVTGSSSTGLLYRDSNEFFERAATAYLGVVGRHRILLLVMWAGLAACIAVVWFRAGSGWALGAIAWMVIFSAAMFVSARLRQSRRASR
jgi:hypothetical protein